MWIDYIELQNIRSYVHARILFQRGVNFISGANGAGKTTIIEAIGLVLFGSKAAGEINNYFLRYGETKGRITLGISILNGYTIEKFEIQRLLGTATSCRIFDETGQLDLSGQDDVYAFLKEKLSLENSEDLAALFENVIAVRQGAFTAPFLAAPNERKKKFNTILQLDHYSRAATESKKLIDEIKKRQQKKLEALAYLDGCLLDKENVQKSYEMMQQLILEKRTVFEQLEIKSQMIEKEYFKQKTIQEKYQQSKDIREKTLLDLEILKKEYFQLEQRGKESVGALQKKQELEPAETVYIQLLEKMDIQKEKNEKFNQLQRKYELLYNAWEQKKQYIELIERNAQENSKQALQKKEDAQKQIKQEKAKNQVFQEQLEQLKRKIIQFKQNKLDLEQDEEQYGQLEIIDRDILSIIERTDEQKKQEQVLIAKLEKKDEIDQRLRESEKNEKRLVVLQQEDKELKITIERLQSDLEKFISGECPYTNEPCTTVQSLEISAEKELQQAKTDLANNTQQKQLISEQLEPSDVLKRQSIELEKDQDLYQELIQQKNNWEKRGMALLEQASEIASQKFDNYHQFNIVVLQNKEKIMIRKKEMQEEQIVQVDAMSQTQSLIAQNKNTIERLLEQMQLAEKEIQEQQMKLDLQKDEKDKQMERWAEIQRLNNEKIQYDGIEETNTLLLKQLDEYKPMHDAYLQNTALAKRSQNDQMKIDQIAQQVTMQEEKLALANEIFLNDQAAFNSELLNQLDQTRMNIAMEISQEQVRLEEKEKQFEGVLKNIQRLQELEDERTKEIGNLEQLNNLQQTTERCRKVYEKTGERMARLLCEQLGHEANRYYRTLSPEETQLVWAENYAIELHDVHNGIARVRSYRALSGGEQISAGIALRLALLKNLSALDIAFFDEPTTHLDSSRRRTLAEVLPAVVGDFSQVFFVSHDDTFDAMAENMIAIGKTADGSVVL